MDIRLTGTAEECDAFVERLRTITRVISARARRPRPGSEDSELVLMDVTTREN